MDIIGVLSWEGKREAECGDGGIFVELSGLGCRYLFVPEKSWLGKGNGMVGSIVSECDNWYCKAIGFLD